MPAGQLHDGNLIVKIDETLVKYSRNESNASIFGCERAKYSEINCFCYLDCREFDSNDVREEDDECADMICLLNGFRSLSVD
jgi:hypothetical protein